MTFWKPEQGSFSTLPDGFRGASGNWNILCMLAGFHNIAPPTTHLVTRPFAQSGGAEAGRGQRPRRGLLSAPPLMHICDAFKGAWESS